MKTKILKILPSMTSKRSLQDDDDVFADPVNVDTTTDASMPFSNANVETTQTS